MEQGQHRGSAIDHRRINHLALAGAAGLDQCGQQTHREVQRPATKIPDEVQRQRRWPVCLPDAVQRAGQRDVVGIVPGPSGHGAILPPSGHPPIDQTLVACHALIRPKPQSLHDAGTKAFEQRIGALAEAEYELAAPIGLQIDVDRRPYKILGACNPQLANRALQAVPDIGLLLPCNVVVRQNDDGSVDVGFLDPGMMSTMVEGDIEAIASDARARRERVSAALAG